MAPPSRWSWRFQLGLAACLFAAVLLSRLPAFFRSVLDWDESLYFLMAAQWRAGHLPYTTIWDNKPIGIYAIFAVFQAVFGETIAAMRIASVVFVTAAAFAVVKITHAMTASVFASVFAGGAFILCALGNDGLAANTELFMACFTTLAVLAAVSGGPGAPFWRGALTGLLLGAALMVKYVAVFEAPAILLLLLSRYRWDRRPAAFAGCCLGGVLPMALTVMVYAHAGLLGLWWDSAIAANLRRLAPGVPAHAIAGAMVLQLRRWGPLYAAGAAMLVAGARRLPLLVRRGPGPGAGHQIFLACWLLGGLVGVASAKSFYDHYFLQVLPVLCICSGCLLAGILPEVADWPRSRLILGVLAFLALPAAAAYGALHDAIGPLVSVHHGVLSWHRDTPARIADDLNAAPDGAGIKLYVFDGQPIIYALTHQPPPTSYVLPSVLTKNFLEHVANVDAPGEVAAILARDPQFIIRDRHPEVNPRTVNQTVYIELDQALAAKYRLWRSYGDLDVYQLDDAATGSRDR